MVPTFSIAGFVLLLGSVGWGLSLLSDSGDGSSWGFGGFGVVLLWTIAIPISFLLGLIGIIQEEYPRFLPWTLLILSGIPVLVIIAEFLLTTSR